MELKVEGWKVEGTAVYLREREYKPFCMISTHIPAAYRHADGMIIYIFVAVWNNMFINRRHAAAMIPGSHMCFCGSTGALQQAKY